LYQVGLTNHFNEFPVYHSGIGEDSSLPEVTQNRGANTFKGEAVEEEQSA